MSGKRAINIDDYLTITALEDDLQASLTISDCQYCVDGSGLWIDLPAETQTVAINKGQTLSFKAYITEPITDNASVLGLGTFAVSKKFELLGNSMSILYGHRARTGRALPQSFPYCFYKLFANNPTLVRVSRNFLPATEHKSYGSYGSMFSGCTSLIQPPAINFNSIPDDGCASMFFGCSSLGRIAEMPALTIGRRGCYRMYEACTSLYYVSKLPAVNLNYECYVRMFAESALDYIPELPATELAEGCYANMFNGASLVLQDSLREITLPATTLAPECYRNMFRNSGIVSAPHLPALRLVKYCYESMFENCNRLIRITMLATEGFEGNMNSWTANVSSEGVFTKNAAAPSSIASYIPQGWTVEEVQV